MSYDSDEGLFHLTPDGWVREDDEPYPADRVETWRYKSSQTSGWSKEYRNLTCIWADPNISRQERDAPRKKHGWPGLDPRDRNHTIGDAL